VLAQSGVFEMVKGSVYIPPQALRREYLQPSAADYKCPWKGHAEYYNITIADRLNEDTTCTLWRNATYLLVFVAF
jgi:uncharacterized protein (DUF427 family)